MSLYLCFNSQQEIDAEYNLSIAVPDIADWLTRYTERSANTRKTHHCHLNIPYGISQDETVDIFPAKDPNAPLVLFIHGGYWVRCSSKDFSCIIEGLVEQGLSVAVSNYSLCPSVTINDITQQHQTLIKWLSTHATEYNVDSSNLFIAGHSAGGQQVAMLIADDGLKAAHLAPNNIKGGIAISGIFDLRPLLHSYLQPKLKLDQNTINRQSPLLNIKTTKTPLLICVGENETAELRRQSSGFHQAWNDAGNNAELRIENKKHHFSIIDGLSNANSPLCKAFHHFIHTNLTP